MQLGFTFVSYAPKLFVTAPFFSSGDELELPDEDDDDDAKDEARNNELDGEDDAFQDEARDNELDDSESVRTSCSGFISMSHFSQSFMSMWCSAILHS